MKAKASLIKQEAELTVTKNEIEAFFDGIIPDFVKQAGGILSDTVRSWRFSNQVRIIKQADAIVQSSGLSKQRVPLKVIYPLLENASFEEDESMQTKWAKLLANAATGSAKVFPNYIELLKQLTPIEASLLDKIYDEAMQEQDYEKRKTKQYSKELVCKAYSITSEDFDVMIENLFRLGLCQAPGSTGIMFGTARVALRTTDVFEITSLGISFVRACR